MPPGGRTVADKPTSNAVSIKMMHRVINKKYTKLDRMTPPSDTIWGGRASLDWLSQRVTQQRYNEWYQWSSPSPRGNLGGWVAVVMTGGPEAFLPFVGGHGGTGGEDRPEWRHNNGVEDNGQSWR